MNKDNAKDYLPLVQALAEGKTIEYRDSDDAWIDCESPTFNQHSSRYRIKPEPKKAWYRVALIKDGGGYWTKAIGCEDYNFMDDKNVTFIRWLTDRIEYELPEEVK